VTPVAAAQAPVITVTKGRPTPAELAAVTTVLLAVAAARAAARPATAVTPSAWAERARALGTLPPPGQRSWRASGLPR
jgi:hypothetical protein